MDRSTPPWVRPDRAQAPARGGHLYTDGGENEDGSEDHEDGSAEGARKKRGEDRATESEAGDEEANDDETNDREGDEDEDRDRDDTPAVDRAGVEVTEAGEAEPADPKWEPPDLEDLSEFELRADEPVARGESNPSDATGDPERPEESTAGMPNTAQAPGTRLDEEGTEGYIAALELCARLPEDVRLPEEVPDLVPAAVEAELEQDVQSFAAAEFDDASPHVETLAFVERDGEVWLRLRLGVAPEAFADLDPEAIRTHALQQLEGMF
jgi:hypothetical protein